MQEIDLSNLDLGDPAKLLKSMMSGNIKDNKGLNNLVGNITSKIEKHIETGKINPEILKREAETLVKDGNSGLNNITSMMENNGDFMKDMMSKMAGFMGDNVNPEQLQEIMKNMDDPDKIAEITKQMESEMKNNNMTQENMQNMQDMQNQLMNMLSGDNTSTQALPPAQMQAQTAPAQTAPAQTAPAPAPAQTAPAQTAPSTTNLDSKKEMLNKLKKLKELKEKKES